MTGAEIQAIREALGFTQEQLGLLLGVSRQAIATWERGRKHIDPWRAALLAHVGRGAGQRSIRDQAARLLITRGPIVAIAWLLRAALEKETR